jgi:sugar diacid utilization regulator
MEKPALLGLRPTTKVPSRARRSYITAKTIVHHLQASGKQMHSPGQIHLFLFVQQQQQQQQQQRYIRVLQLVHLSTKQTLLTKTLRATITEGESISRMNGTIVN